MSRARAFWVGPAAVLWAAAASARPEFPAAVAGVTGHTPDCGLCHVGGQSSATVATPFGLALKCRGVTSSTTLATALKDMATQHVDADGDGAADIDQLSNGQSPTGDGAKGDLRCPTDPPTYGCRVAGERGALPLATAALVALGLLVSSRRRARR